MTDETPPGPRGGTPDEVAAAFENHDAFERIETPVPDDAVPDDVDANDADPDDADPDDADPDDADPDATAAFRLTTTVFETRISADSGDGPLVDYHVTVFVPTLRGAVADDSVGDAVQDGWLETFERRLEDAPKATRAAVDLDGFDVSTDDETVAVRYDFSFGNADRAVEIAKTFVEYVEGTYVEGVVPGYDYESPVTDLLGAATTGSDGERGGTPL